MTDPEIAIEIADVLRKIGRNVVVLQKIEGQLKCLVTIQGLKTPIENPESVRKRVKAVAKRPMGHLVSEFLDKAYRPADEQVEPLGSQSVVETTISFSLDTDLADSHKKSLSAVVAERNRLIHGMLIDFNPQSNESRHKLSEALDSQLERILPEFELLASLLASLRKSFTQVQDYVDSERFLAHLKTVQD